jgi:hypothetical protein
MRRNDAVLSIVKAFGISASYVLAVIPEMRPGFRPSAHFLCRQEATAYRSSKGDAFAFNAGDDGRIFLGVLANFDQRPLPSPLAFTMDK